MKGVGVTPSCKSAAVHTQDHKPSALSSFSACFRAQVSMVLSGLAGNATRNMNAEAAIAEYLPQRRSIQDNCYGLPCTCMAQHCSYGRVYSSQKLRCWRRYPQLKVPACELIGRHQ